MTDVLRVRNLKVYLDVDAGVVKAVDGVSFRVPKTPRKRQGHQEKQKSPSLESKPSATV